MLPDHRSREEERDARFSSHLARVNAVARGEQRLPAVRARAPCASGESGVRSAPPLPHAQVTSAMRALAPGVALLDGDGRRLVQARQTRPVWHDS
eukprot:3814475-Pleurochrysis_carterae.AAC.7